MSRPLRLALAALATLGLAGCASFSADGGFGPVEQAARRHLDKPVQWPRSEAEREHSAARVRELLAAPLSMDAAVQIAMLANPGLQAEFETLGIAEADLVQAGRLPNPGFSFGHFTRGDEVERERSLHFDLARLLAWPLVQRIEQRRFEQAQGVAATRVLALAADTRRAWVQAVAAEESVRYATQVMRAAEASAELARRMAQVGNFTRLQQLREQGFYADAALGLARARQAQLSTRERLTRLLGLWGADTAFRLPQRLPELPAAPREQPDIERLALAQRLDVQGMRLAVDQTARELGLTQVTRWVNMLELGYSHSRSNEEATQRGWEIGFELPLFDWGQVRTARAEARYRQALQRAAATAIDARSEVREAYGAYRTAWEIARHHRDELVPLRQRIAEENVLRYNGMLIGVFELLADARSQIAGVNAAIDALRDFWLAQAELDMALVGPPNLAAAAALSGALASAEAGAAGH